MSGDAQYEAGAMYIILSTLENGGMHWGIFLMVSPPFGMIYNATDNNGPWRLDAHMTENVVSSVSILAGLMIQRHIDESMLDRIDNVLTQVPCPPQGGYMSQWGENFRCGIWVKDAVERLRLAGLIEDCPAEEICDEALNLGRSARTTGQRRLIEPSTVIFRGKNGGS
ncbi:hypothetical protein LAWI1_G006063 [Lachnellula willkommii]|uniref:Uncharacterized protein n=1 Tax=Lachnellula willkommii TaxID=215461 RepID=A0A559M8W9_9HELO|nr:hypothetical protein LAWI1_G006063 [Lachnellula willkommii]